MSKEPKLYTIVKCPKDYYEGSEAIVGYADNEASAQQMLKQAETLNPQRDYRIDRIEIVNLLFDI